MFLTAITVLAAEDAWEKVKKLKSGVELRIWKRGIVQPVLAKMDELTTENLLVVVKNEQLAVPKDRIERIDYRPPSGSRVTKESKTTISPPDPRPSPEGSGRPSTSTSSGVSIGSKPDFETIYSRPPR